MKVLNFVFYMYMHVRYYEMVHQYTCMSRIYVEPYNIETS